MTTLAAAMPHIVDQIDQGKQGWKTKADLMLLVAWRTALEGTWTQIDRPVLVAHLRTEWAGRWALAVLGELAEEHRMLRMREGHPRLWRIAGEDLESILLWRGIPWIGSRKRALGLIRARVACVGVGPVAVSAGQPANPMAGDTRFGHLGDLDLSAKHPPSAPHQPPPAPRSADADEDFCGPQPPSAPRSGGAPVCVSGLLRNPSVSSDPEGGSENGPTEELRSLVKAIAQVCFEVSGDPIAGTPLRRAEAIAAAQLAHREELLAYAATLKTRGLRRWGGVLDALEAWQPAPPPPARPKCGECEALLRSDRFCCGQVWP